MRDRVLDELKRKPGQKASELARTLNCDRRDVNRCLSFELAAQVRQGSDYRWQLAEMGRTETRSDTTSNSEISKLARYYLECISQDMDEGASTFASSQYGDPNYASLTSVPFSTGDSWWNSQGVGRLLGKVRAERGKLMLWLGYPVRLRYQQSARWRGYFVEPVLMWPVVLPEANGEAPSIDALLPTINTKFLKSVTLGDNAQIAGEAARLSDELGLNAPADELPDVEDLADRLARIRPDWDWKESLDPCACADSPSLAELSSAGIYNRAIIIPAERSPYTQGLEAELKQLGELPDTQLASTALGRWLTLNVNAESAVTAEDQPLLEVLPMNTEQRMAVRAAMTAPHTVVTGPPGTGKSQVVTNLLVNAAWRGMKVLFASKNNKAVDVVEARVNGLGNRPVLLRLGAKDYQSRLAGYLSQLLAGNPGAEAKAAYEESLALHRNLTDRHRKLERTRQETLDCRNEVDRLDTEAESARKTFGGGFANLTSATRDRAENDFVALYTAVDAADRGSQGAFVRIFWFAYRTARLRNLERAVRESAPSLKVFQVDWRAWKEEDGISVLRERLEHCRERRDELRKAVQFREALQRLQSLPTFEEIAAQSAALATEVSLNSARLWRDWVQLAPTRLSPKERTDVADYAAALQAITRPDAENVHYSVKQRARALQSKVTALFSCCAVTSLSARGRVPMEPGFFDLVVIDEASQCDIASALPLLYRAKRSVIIGDPMQLKHISSLTKQRDSELLNKHDLVGNRLSWMYSVSSLFDVAAGVLPTDRIVNLRDHHRSHADIIEFSNKAFYEGRLRVATRYPQLKRPKRDQPGIVWQNVPGTVTRPNSGGAQNEKEAKALAAAVFDLLIARGYTGTVGVVTPFNAQARLLEKIILSMPEIESVRGRSELVIDTVHKFQGDERDVMFFSPVVSDGIAPGPISFLRSNGNLFNVAITRARGLLHVVGDRTAASSCGVDYLQSFSEYVSRLDMVRNATAPVSAKEISAEYPPVTQPERVSEWEKILYRAMVRAGLKPIPQYSVEQYDLDLALLDGERRLAIEVDGERYHRSWTGELCLRDQLRNQRLIELGWEVRRYWVYEIRDELSRCVQKLVDWNASAKPHH